MTARGPASPAKMKHRGLSLSARINLSTLALLSFLMIAVGVLAYSIEKNRSYNDLYEAVDSALLRISTSVAEPLWTMDNSIAEQIIRSEMSLPFITTIAVNSGDTAQQQRPFVILHRQMTDVDEYKAEKDQDVNFTADSEITEVTTSTVVLQNEWPDDEEAWLDRKSEIVRNGTVIGTVRIAATDQYLRNELQRLLFAIVCLVLAFNLLLFGILYLLLRRLVIRPLINSVALSGIISGKNRLLTQSVQEIAKGDFSQSIDLSQQDHGDLKGFKACLARTDEIGVLFRSLEDISSRQHNLISALQTMNASMHDSLNLVVDASREVGQGARQIAETSELLSNNATHSAASLEQITTSMTRIDSQSRHNAKNANQANLLASEARNSVERGSSRMKEMVTAMGAINDSSQQIARIIKTIDEIAFQTNLLALNAAVEAARAGHHGKGFAVVAEEVRSLAARSARAARETAELIESSNEKVARGTEIADQTSEALSDIVAGITKASDLVAEIAAASNEQAKGVAEVGQGLEQIDDVTQKNAAHAEETASAAEELSAQAANLQNMLTRFRLKRTGPARHTQKTVRFDASIPARHQWGDVQHNRTVKKGVVDPSLEIRLDDKEFEKY